MIIGSIEMNSMTDKVFIDTNVWVYLYAKTPIDKYQKAYDIIEQEFENILLSSQVLGELYNVLTRKKIASTKDAQRIVVELVDAFPVAAVSADLVLKAVQLQLAHQYSYWDSLIITTAILNRCSRLYSEDLHAGQEFEGVTTIVSPFS
jgi:predicted nucleic acid-binding protein